MIIIWPGIFLLICDVATEMLQNDKIKVDQIVSIENERQRDSGPMSP